MKKTILIVFLFISSFTWANNLSITNVTKLSDTQLQFDVTWDNSWYSNGYYDAAWIFIKIKGADGVWSHLDVSTASSTTNLTVLPIPTDNKGILIRRTNTGTGSVSGTIVFDFVTSS